MAYSKDPNSYPSEFASILARASTESFEFTCDSPQQAHSLRHQLHGYRRAAEARRLPGWSELRRVQISINGSTLIFNSTKQLLAGLLASSGTESTPSDDELEQYLADMEKQTDEE